MTQQQLIDYIRSHGANLGNIGAALVKAAHKREGKS
jgi:hypothetical protein